MDLCDTIFIADVNTFIVDVNLLSVDSGFTAVSPLS